MSNKPLDRNEIHAACLRGELWVNTAVQSSASPDTADVSAAVPAKEMDKFPEKAEFTGLGYSGTDIKQAWSWYPVVIDIDGIDAYLPLPVLGDHVNRCSSSLGQHTTLSLDNSSVMSTGVIYPRYSSVAAYIYNTDALGHKWQMSIAGPIRSIEEVKDGEQVTVNNRVFTGPLYIVRRMTLREITVVPVGADVNTQFSIKK